MEARSVTVLGILALIGSLVLCSPAAASKEDILAVNKFGYESNAMHADFTHAFVEGERVADGRLSALNIGFNGVEVSVDPAITNQIPAHAAFLQMTGELGNKLGGKRLTVYFPSPISQTDRSCFTNSYLSVDESGSVHLRHSGAACRTVPQAHRSR